MIPGLALSRVGYVYARRSPWEHRALRAVDLSVAPGETVAVHGPNGSGKSTLFWILAGARTPSEGSALLDGVPLPAATQRIGVCLQMARLQLFGRTVAADLALGAARGAASVPAALAAVGLDPSFAGRPVDRLSGGEQRLVAIAGALAREPRLLVLDEPFAGLDAPHCERVLQAVAVARASGAAVVVLTPDPADAARCGRVVELTAGAAS